MPVSLTVKARKLEQLVNLGSEYAIKLVRLRCQDESDPDQKLPFHGVDHTMSVISRATKLAESMKLGRDRVQLIRLFAAFHDTMQRWEESPMPDGRVMRKRDVGGNKAFSAAELVSFIGDKLSEKEKQLGMQAIMVTVFKWDAAKGTVYQPNLLPISDPVIKCIALADLGTAGMEGEIFVGERDLIFQEDNLDIARALRSAKHHDDISEDDQYLFRIRMFDWSCSQPAFALGRKNRLEIELGNLDDDSKVRVRNLFSRFDEAIKASEEVFASRQDMNFWSIAKAMGYRIPNS